MDWRESDRAKMSGGSCDGLIPDQWSASSVFSEQTFTREAREVGNVPSNPLAAKVAL